MANDDLNIANNAINNARGKMINNEFKRDRSNIVSSVAAEVARMFKPFLKEIRETAQVDKQDLLNALSQITVEGTPSNVTVPEIKVPEINVPEPRVHVTVPPVRVPDVIMPDEMNIRGFVGLMGVDLQNPLPVQLRDENGGIVNLLENITAISGGGGGGSRGTVKIINDSGSPVPITGTLSATLSADTGSGEIGSETLRIVQATNAISSVNVVDAFGSTAVSDVINADNRIRVSVETGGSGLTDAELRASHLDINQVSGTELSTVVNSGTIDTLTTITNDVSIDDGGNTITVDGTVTATPSGTQDVDVTANSIGLATSAKQLADDHNVTVSSVTASTTAIIGDKRADEADGDSNPVKVGGVARTANPTAVANGDRVSATYDDVGRQVMRPVQVRDLLQTAFAAVTNGTETTLLAGTAGVFHDLVYMMGANHSDAAVQVDIRQTTGGTIQSSLEIPANSTAGLALGGATLPQDHADSTWTVDLGDDTQDCDITALFSKEV
jgi:hypothetical protein